MKIWSLSNPCSHGEQLLHCTKLCHTTLYYVYYNTHQDLISLQPAKQRTAIPLHQTTWHHTLCYANYHMHKDLLLFKSIQHGGAVVSLYYTMPHHTRPCHTTLYCVYYHTRQDLILSSLSNGSSHFTILHHTTLHHATLHYTVYTIIRTKIWSFQVYPVWGSSHFTIPHHTTLCTLHYAMYTTLCTLHYAMYTILCYVHYHMHHDLILFKSIQQRTAVVSLYHTTTPHYTMICTLHYAMYTMLCTLHYAHYTMLCTLQYAPWSDPFQIHPARESSCFTIPHHATPHYTMLCTLHYAMYTMLCTLHYAMYTTTCTMIWSFSNPSSKGEQLFHYTTPCNTTLHNAMHTTLCYANYRTHQDLILFKSVQHGGAAVPVDGHAVQFDQLKNNHHESPLPLPPEPPLSDTIISITISDSWYHDHY